VTFTLEATLSNRKREETIMPTFLITANLTEQGIRNVKEVPKRDALHAKPPRNSALRLSKSI